MNTADILRAAAARVRQGWTQGIGITFTGRVCAYGGISVAVCGDGRYRSGFTRNMTDEEVEAINAAINAAGVWLQHAITGSVDLLIFWPVVFQWNDAPGQTAENVALGLETAALLWEQQHVTPSERVAHVEAAK